RPGARARGVPGGTRDERRGGDRNDARLAGPAGDARRGWALGRGRRGAARAAVGASVADREEADVPAALELPVRLCVVARVDDLMRVLAVDDAAVLVRVHDRLRVGPRPHVVERVVGVDEVPAGACADDRGLALLTARVVVAPDHVAGV